MDAWYERLVERIPGVQGGEPVIRGTRTPVRTVVILCTTTYPACRDQVLAALPHLSEEQVEAALAYYRDHPAEIDAEIDRHRVALREFLQAS